MHKWLLPILFLPTLVFSHGGDQVSFGGDEAKLAAFDLPVQIGLDGDIGLHSPIEFGEDEHEGEEHSGLEVAFAPILGLGLNFKNRKISLEHSETSDATLLEPVSPYSEFDYVRIRQFQAGLGAETTLGSHTTGAFFVGLMPYKGTSLISKNKINTTSVLPKLSVPHNQIDFLAWSEGDSLEYQTEGGVMFSAAFGHHLYGNIGGTLMLSGSWNVRVVKREEEFVQVAISQSKMKSAGVSVGNMITSLGMNWMKGHTHSFSYIFDLSQPSGLSAYQEFLQGKLNSALLLSQNYEGAVKESSMDKVTNGRIKSFSLGTPLLAGLQKANGLMYEVSNVEEFLEGHKETIFSHIFAKSTEANGALIKDFKRLSFVISMVNTHSEEEDHEDEHEEEHEEAAFKKRLTFKWFYEKERQGLKKLNHFLKKSLKRFDISSKELKFYQHQLGYVRAETDFTLEENHLNQLESKVNDGFWSQWETKRLRDVARVCGNKLLCLKLKSIKVRQNMRELKSSFAALLLAQRKSDFKNISKAVNLFGQALFESPLNLSILATEVKDLKLVVTIRGEKFKAYYRVYKLN